jgi:hypothetical protein
VRAGPNNPSKVRLEVVTDKAIFDPRKGKDRDCKGSFKKQPSLPISVAQAQI